MDDPDALAAALSRMFGGPIRGLRQLAGCLATLERLAVANPRYPAQPPS
ncbi:MAG: hypothetical protein ACR2G2_03935 [Pseudonocardia sp.]